jgi:hypothetical protein
VIGSRYTAIQEKKLQRLKLRIKQITRRNNGNNVKDVIRKLNPVLRGFVNYFRVANCSGVLNKLMCWVRRRIRCLQLKQWKKPQKLHRRLRSLGYDTSTFQLINMNSWRNAASHLASYAMPNRWFHEELGLINMAETKTGLCVSPM